MKTKFSLLFACSIFFLVLSCSKDDNQQNIPAAVPTGNLTGKVMVKNGSKPVGSATVFVLGDDSKLYATHTDASGNFSLKAPVGNRKLQIQTGGGANFRTSISVEVVKDQTIAIDPTTTRLDQVARMAYVAGSYDNIQSIVTDLGYTIEGITHQDLQNYAIVSQYDIIFLNCGAKQNDPNQATIDTNLANFVTNGGSLYASDWAVAYLTGGAINSHNCGEANGFIPDDKLCAKSTGETGTISGAVVAYPDLASALNFSNLDITYDLGGWEQINNYDPTFWDVLVSDATTNAALMIKTNQFNGGSIITEVGRTAADEDWITICHHESESEPITITIPVSDWPAHQAHGDTVGECTASGTNGTIYYTTFHNHAGGNIGNTSLILEYVILNL